LLIPIPGPVCTASKLPINRKSNDERVLERITLDLS